MTKKERKHREYSETQRMEPIQGMLRRMGVRQSDTIRQDKYQRKVNGSL
jgi:hypothetical protein